MIKLEQAIGLALVAQEEADTCLRVLEREMGATELAAWLADPELIDSDDFMKGYLIGVANAKGMSLGEMWSPVERVASQRVESDRGEEDGS